MMTDKNSLGVGTGNLVPKEMDMDTLLPLVSLTDLNKYRSLNLSDGEELSENEQETSTKQSEEKAGTQKMHKKYSDQDKQRFFDLWTEKPGESIASVARSASIHPRTAQNWVKEYEESESEDIPRLKKRGRKNMLDLGEGQKQQITQLLDEISSATLNDITEELNKSFSDLNVSKTALHHFMLNECFFSFTLPKKESVKHDDSQGLKRGLKRGSTLSDAMAKVHLDYCTNCVFIDEAELQISIRRNGALSKKDTTPGVKTHLTCAEIRTILGAICYDGVVKLSLRKPVVQIAGYFEQFLTDVMDVLDGDERWNKSFLIMNGESHKTSRILRMVNVRGYTCVFLPQFSSELNPIEQFWHAMKSKLKREKFLANETLSTRIEDAAHDVLLDSIHGFIEDSKRLLENYVKEPL